MKTFYLDHTTRSVFAVAEVEEIAQRYGAELIAVNGLAADDAREVPAQKGDTTYLFKIVAEGPVRADGVLFNIECDLDAEEDDEEFPAIV